MTEKERELAFINALREAERKFGCTVVAVTQTKKYGEAVMVEAGIQVTAMVGWVPPVEKMDNESEIENE